MTKATHTGECQCCGARQKLPSGNLAKHGYTVKQRGSWGWFEGTCDGSDNLPLEISKDLVEVYIARTLERRASTIAFIEALRIPATEQKAWFHDYHPQFRYVWRQVPISRTSEGRLAITRYGHGYAGNLPQERVEDAYRSSAMDYSDKFETELELASHMNRKYATHLEGRDIRQMDQYIAWQRKRIADWKPKRLKSV